MTDIPSDTPDVVVVGGGLAGLTAAGLLARGGRTVTLFERSRRLGGRAITREEGGFHFNLGPHALYRTGPGMAALEELEIPIDGGRPPRGGHAMLGDALHTLPAGPWSLLRTSLLGWNEKLETGRLLAILRRVDPSTLSDRSTDRWLQSLTRNPDVRRLLEAIVRLSTYVDATHALSADVAATQLQLAFDGVTYLDRGWQRLVDALASRAEEAGARLVTGTKVLDVVADERVERVRLDGGTELRPEAVVVATSPEAAGRVVTGAASGVFQRWAEAATPVLAATLDVGLDSLPRPEIRFAIGIDRPLYFSVHSEVADLAPGDAAMVHVSKYLADGEAEDPAEAEDELVRFLERLQPGWRDRFVERRYLPRLTVQTALATPAMGGLAGRPGPAVDGVEGLYVAGDWVGREGWLSDASRASARAAARAILAAARPTTAPRSS